MKIALSAALPVALAGAAVLSLAALCVPAAASPLQQQAGLTARSAAAAPQVAKKGKVVKKSTKGKKARARNR